MSNSSLSSSILVVKDLEVSFGNRKVLKRINFSIGKSEIVGIVGESGSGKSLTAQAIMGLINTPPATIHDGHIHFTSPKSGQVEMLGLPDDSIRKIRGSEISMIFQEPMTSLNPLFTCGDQVAEVLLKKTKIPQAKVNQKVIELFENVKLPRPEKIVHSFPHEISGGQKQRVMIAMAMATNPSILIADEPTTALDVTVQSSILDLIQELRYNFQTSVLFISHDLGVIAEIADKVIVMRDGEILEYGDIMETYANPKHNYTKGLLACRPRLEVKLKKLPTVQDFFTKDEKGATYKSIGEALLLNAESSKVVMKKQIERMNKPPLLLVQDLQVNFKIRKGLFGKSSGMVSAVDHVSFEVFKGETLGLVGESGCGKTTLGRALLGLVPISGGKITYDEREITHMTTKQIREIRQNIQIIFQDPFSSLNPRKKVGEAILESMLVHHKTHDRNSGKQKVLGLLERVGLEPGHYNRFPHEFSGGQRQRISIARTLALEPSFIICDESVSALDVSVQAQVLNLLNDLKHDFNLTYIFISHDLSVIKFIADRIIVMEKGKIVESGLPDKLYEKPGVDYTRRLIEAIPKGDLQDIRKAQLKRKMKLLNKPSS